MSKPLLSRIKMATVGAPSVDDFVRLYTTWLGYTVQAQSTVSNSLAQSWGTPNSAGRQMVTLQSAAMDDVYLRAVEVDPVPGYWAMTTWGWSAIEIIVDDIEALVVELKDSDFEHIGGPANLMGGASSIRAAQYKGPAEDVIYLTCETGDREQSTLPLPRSKVDRPFVMVLAGPDITELENFYVGTFNLNPEPHRDYNLDLVSQAQGQPAGTTYPLGLLRLGERGNNIELDEYPAGTSARPSADGQLPPGVAMTTFSVEDLSAIDIDFIADPVIDNGGKRAATLIGPAGELTELIEDPRP